MKLKPIIMALFLCMTIILFNGVNSRIRAISSDDCNYRVCDNSHRRQYQNARPDMLRNSIEELQKSGVLDEDDISRIKEFNRKKMKEEEQKKYSVIDEMVEENVISKEKGQKLKAIISQKVEDFIKEGKAS